jgi:hypothetical protein
MHSLGVSLWTCKEDSQIGNTILRLLGRSGQSLRKAVALAEARLKQENEFGEAVPFGGLTTINKNGLGDCAS